MADGMKVLLVNSNRVKPPVAPIGLDYLADALRAAGHEPVLLDLCFSPDVERDVGAALASFSPDAVGVSVRNTDDSVLGSDGFLLPGVREIVRCLRDHTEAPVVLGGVGYSIMPEAVAEYCNADFGIAGEGEEAFPRLLAALRDGADLDAVPGLVWWDEGGPRRNPPVDVPPERLPARTRSFVDNGRYFAEGGQAGFETKRGCPMTCSYCADPIAKGRRSRLVPPKAVVEELRALLGQGIDVLHACDCEMNLPIVHAREVCQAIIDAGLSERLRWYAYCSPAPFDDETARLFKRAGCAGLDFGADSGSAEMLRRLGRHFGPADLEAAARACREAGIPFMFDLLVGAPGETPQSVRESLDLVRRAAPDCIGVSLGVRLYEGTALADQVRRTEDDAAGLRGARIDNDRLLRPVFYVSPELGSEPEALLRELAGGDPRFFLPAGPEAAAPANYNGNDALARAIAAGERGAYWDILRRMRARDG
jgi:tryptophan 2-C-methyltransferase